MDCVIKMNETIVTTIQTLKIAVKTILNSKSCMNKNQAADENNKDIEKYY